MSGLFDDAAPRFLTALMSVTVKQHGVAAANIANIDTPGYRAKALEFRRAFEAALGDDATGMARTVAGHMGGAGLSVAASLDEVTGLPIRNDGNNVSIDREMLALASASGRYNAAVTLLRRDFALLRYAISGGRSG